MLDILQFIGSSGFVCIGRDEVVCCEVGERNGWIYRPVWRGLMSFVGITLSYIVPG